MSERIVDLPNGGAAEECTRLHGAKTLYGYDLHEEIVRCRDCKRWSNEPPHYREEPQWCGRFACHAEPDGFCSWGELR